jgi:hypothetical protein
MVIGGMCDLLRFDDPSKKSRAPQPGTQIGRDERVDNAERRDDDRECPQPYVRFSRTKVHALSPCSNARL